MLDAFYPGKPWLDTEGKRIQAHGGSLLYHEGTFYWYGEDKTLTDGISPIWHHGVRLYASRDLYNWEDKGTILKVSEDPMNPMHPHRIMDRPHILYNTGTKQFVMWVKFAGNAENPGDWRDQYMGVAVSEDIEKPFRMVRTLHPLGMNSGDFDLMADPADGKGYIVFDRVHTEMVIADLTEDYTDVNGYYSSHFPKGHPPYTREAPAYFYRQGTHYLLTSGTTGYFPNPSEIAASGLMHGPWQELGDPHIGDPGHTSFDSQICSVFRHPLKKDLYIALADRWLVDLPEKRPDIAGYFDAQFSGNHAVLADLEGLDHLSANNTSLADYIWLPILFEQVRPCIRWFDSWRTEDFE